ADCPSSCSTAFGSSYLTSTNEIYNTSSSTTLSFAPGDYVFCNFETNGPVNITASSSSAPVRIFIDTNAAHCPGTPSHSGSLPTNFKSSGSNFIANQGIGGLIGGVTGTLSPSQVQVYVVGSGSVTTSGSVANAFFLYAPQATVSVASTVSFTGTVIGYDVTMNTILYTQSLGLNNYPISSSLGIFHTSQYRQCTNSVTALTGTSATDAAGC
ncbi:MAG TPA: hypothetical protein VG295_10725, partial [Solirubrobacteraceae bacterium]|nr:hypothetical protein [Solirubrobacteraceae bacterium]